MKKIKNRGIKGAEFVKSSPRLTAIKSEHVNQWVALSRDYKKVVASSDSLLMLAQNTKDQDVLLVKAAPMLVSYAPLGK